MKSNKRRNKGKFKAHMSLFWILVVTLISVISYSGVNDVLVVQPAIASAIDKQLTYSNFHASSVEEENELLRQKIERSNKVATPETTKQLVRFYIHKYFPQSQWETAEKVATCESGMNPMSINDKNTNGSTDRGAFQINSVHAARFTAMYGVDWKIGAHDIDSSVKYARFLWDHSGWNPWVCYKIVK